MKKVLNIFGDITSEKWYDEDVTPTVVSDAVKGLTSSDELEININCYGGEVFAAVAMLRAYDSMTLRTRTGSRCVPVTRLISTSTMFAI